MSGATVSSRRRQLARAVVKAKTLEARREAAAALSNYIDMEEGWVPPIRNLGLDGTFKREKSKTKSRRAEKGRSRRGRKPLGNLNNMDRISARRVLVKAARDLERRTVGRLIEDRETKAKIRNGAPLTPVGQKSVVPKTLEEYEAAGLAELLEGYTSPEPVVSSPTKSKSLQRVLLEMRENSASQHWRGEARGTENKSKSKVKSSDSAWMRAPKGVVSGATPGSAPGSSRPVDEKGTSGVSLATSRSSASAVESEVTSSERSVESQTSLPPVPNIKIGATELDHAETASVAGSDASSLTEGSEFDYAQPYLRRPELLGVPLPSTIDALSFAGLAPGAAFFGQFLNGGILQNCLSDPSLCFPDTLVRLHVGGKFRWVWIEAGAQSAEEIMYLDRPLAVRREHIIARLCGGWNMERNGRTRSSPPKDGSVKNEALLLDSSDPHPLAVFKRSTGIASADTHVLFHRDDVVEYMKEIFSTGTKEVGGKDKCQGLSARSRSNISCLILQRFVGGRVAENVGSSVPLALTRKKNARLKHQHAKGESWISKDDPVTRLVRVRSRCGRGSATVWTIEGGGEISLKMATRNARISADAGCSQVSGSRPQTVASGGSSESVTASTRVATAQVAPGSEAGMLSMTPVHLVSSQDPMCRVLRQDSLAARQTAIGPAVSLVRSLVHLLSETYPRLLFSELTADYVPDRANPGQFWLLQIKGFRAKGPPSALPPAEKSSEAALGAAAVALATSRRILRSAPSGQSTGTFPSLSTVRGDRAGFQSAWRAQNDGRRGSAARRRRRDGTEKQSKKNPHRRPVSSQALRDLSSKRGFRTKKCLGDYCGAGEADKGGQSYQVGARILFKSIAEDRVQARPGDDLPARFRARMYDEVAVCAACFEEYSRRDTERAKALAQAQARARAFVVASEAKYAKFQGKGTRRKVNPANSGLIKRYEARRAQEKRAKQDMLEQGRKDKELRKLQLQTKRKDMRKSLKNSSHEVENGDLNPRGSSLLAAGDRAGQSEKECVECAQNDEGAVQQQQQQQLDDDINQCLLCGAGVAQCRCSLTPRPEVRALMSRVDTAFFS